MSRVVRTVIALALVGLVIGVLGIAAIVAWADPLAHAVITVDGNEVTLAQVHGGAALMVLAAVVVVIAVAFVVPLAVLVPLLTALLAIVAVLLAIAGTLAIALSPLLLLGWLIWRVARPSRRPVIS